VAPGGQLVHTAGLSPLIAPARKIMEVNALGTSMGRLEEKSGASAIVAHGAI
jgi:hypothetical protein